jgi:hypothetical protein
LKEPLLVVSAALPLAPGQQEKPSWNFLGWIWISDLRTIA